MRTQIWIGVLVVLSASITGIANAQLSGIGSVITISHAQEKADIGEYFAIEGVVTHIRESRFFKLQDATGEMVVLIPEYLTRDAGLPKLNERIRVSGKYDRKKLDHNLKGMRVARLELLGQFVGLRGKADPDAGELMPISEPKDKSELPPAAQAVPAEQPGTVTPVLTKDLKEQLRAKRIAFDAAMVEVDEAAAEYARALYKAGDSGVVDESTLARLEKAEAHRNQLRVEITPLVEQAREAGVSPAVIKMYESMTIERY